MSCFLINIHKDMMKLPVERSVHVKFSFFLQPFAINSYRMPNGREIVRWGRAVGTDTCAARKLKLRGGTRAPTRQNPIRLNKHAPSNNNNSPRLRRRRPVPETVPHFPNYLLLCSPTIWLINAHFSVSAERGGVPWPKRRS